MATHSSILAWWIPWTEEPGELQSMGLQRVEYDRSDSITTTRFLCPWDFPGEDARVGCHFLLQGIFVTQGSNSNLLCLLQWQADL